MHPTLEKLIRLQELDNTSERARRALSDIPVRLAAIETVTADAAAALEAARHRLADNQAARRQIEKDLAVVQTRLGRFKDQIMEVKTNKEYHAMQKEMAVAEHEVRALEDQILELMVLADDLATDVRRADEAQATAAREAIQARAALDTERARDERTLEEAAAQRRQLAAEIDADALALFDSIARARRGLAVVEARDGHCSECHVRLRPQVFNDIRRNDTLIQCESCGRLLHFVAAAVGPASQP
jgi:hypothetical protein